MVTHALPNPQLTQIAMCAADLPATVRFYAEVFGFARSGGKVLWGERVAQIQGLGEDAQFLVSWMVGRQDFVQLELFHHTKPALKPRSASWRPCDLGYTRFGIAVPDFDATMDRLAATGTAQIAPPAMYDGLRRVCFIDPNGIVVEVLEDGLGLPGGLRRRRFPLEPAVIYAAVSVPDIEKSRRFYVETLGLVEEPGELLHTPEMERLWGLDGADRDLALASAGDIFFEIVQYRDPVPRPHPEGYLLSDQGFLNVAFAFRERPLFDEMLERALAAGYHANYLPVAGTGFASTYLTDDQGYSVEIFGCPREFDSALGFEPEPGFAPAASASEAPIIGLTIGLAATARR